MQVDMPIGINFVRQQHLFVAPVICAIVRDEVGHDGKLYFHTVHLRCNFNYFFNKNGNEYQELRDFFDLSIHTALFIGEDTHQIFKILYDIKSVSPHP